VRAGRLDPADAARHIEAILQPAFTATTSRAF
jgi:hypothetical protein